MQDNSDAIALRSVAVVLKRRWKLITSIGLLGAGAAAAIGILIEPRYTAKAQIVVEAPVSNSIVGTLDEAAIETRVELLLSESHLKQVLEALGNDGQSLSPRRGALFSLWSSNDDGESAASEIKVLQKNVNAFKERKSRVIGITYTAPDPVLAADVANKSVAVFFESLARNRQREREEKLRSLDAQLPRARAEAERADAALQAYRAEAGLVESKRADLTQEEMADLTRQLSIARSELAQRQEKIRLLRNFVLTGAGARDLGEALQDPSFTEAVRESLLEKPAVRDQNSQPDRSEPAGRIGATVKQHLAKVTDEAERFTSRVRSLQQRLDMFRHANGETRTAEIRLRELERESSVATQLLQSLLQQHVELRSSSPEPLDTRLASAASPPEYPSSPNPILFIPPAVTVALVFAGLIAVLLERMDDTLRSQRDFAELLGVPCAGLVPETRRKAIKRSHLDLQKTPFAPFSEAMRKIALGILTPADATSPVTVLAVTSSMQGEGKTTLATCLAAYLTLIEKRVLILDLDFRNPGYGVAKSGNLDALGGRRPRDEIVRRIQQTKVDYLPMQEFQGDPLTSLDVGSFAEKVRALGAGYDFVILDTGPLLGASETALFCQAADLIMFSVAWGSTRRDIARNALQLIDPSKTVGILTRVDLRQHAKFRFGDVGEALSHAPLRPPQKVA